ncbi:hypothetical protein REPUB_Repub19eG0000500 [Reevesia pubescens]
MLKISPTLFAPSNPVVQLERSLPDQAYSYWNSRKGVCYGSIKSAASNGTPGQKSSVELSREIAALEVQILHLERYLLSLYRTAFEEHLPATLSNIAGTHLECKRARARKCDFENYDQPSPAHDWFISDNQISPFSSNKATSARDGIISNSGHRSLADYLSASCMDKSLYTPDRLSENIVRCISSIYCKLSNVPQAHAGLSASPVSFLSSSSIFSSKTPCDSWSPCNNEEFKRNNQFQGLKEESGPHAAIIEVLKIRLDSDSFNYAALMLRNFRSLVRNLEKVDPRKMKREEKLAFWINIHNALVMHACLAYGTHNRVKSSSIMKAECNVGGCQINAYIIQSSILGIQPHQSAPWLQTLFSPGWKAKATSTKHVYALEYPEPQVHFALCSGDYSGPAVRVYTAENIFRDLKLGMEEFIHSSVYIHKEMKIFLPKVLYYFSKDMSLDMKNLLEVVSGCVSVEQGKCIQKCMKRQSDKYIRWLSQSSSFRYVIQGQLAKEE